MASNDTLQGWNAIAEYLQCDVRTAKRWESERGLPIRRTRRTPGAGRASVHALTAELEAWLTSAKIVDEPREWNTVTEPVEEAETAAFAERRAEATGPAEGQLLDPPLETLAARKQAASPQRGRKLMLAAAGAMSACLVGFGALLWVHSHGAVRAGAESVATGAAKHGAAGVSREVTAAGAAGGNVQELYLHGSYLFEQRTPETLMQARRDFEQALKADANYAPAYAGLAKTYDLLREYATMPSEQAYPLAKAAALRAIALDPKLADAHTALGYEEFFWEWDAAAAEREFRQAILLDANSGLAHHWYGAMLTHQARFAEAIHELDRAQVLEPASAGVLGTRAYAIGLSGRRGEAVDMLQDILGRVPDSAPLHFILAQLCLQEPRDIPRYLDEMRRFTALRHDADEARLIGAAEPAYRNGGEAAMWRAMLAAEQQMHRNGTPTFRWAEFEAAAGMKDEALRDLAELAKRHDAQMIGIEIDTVLKPLQGDPRFQALVQQVGLPRN
jgi:tetratricopeptide (TPR) repeat protein